MDHIYVRLWFVTVGTILFLTACSASPSSNSAAAGASETSQPESLLEVPGAIEALSAAPGDRSVVVSFSAPNTDTVDRYEYSVNDGPWQELTESLLAPGPPLSFTLLDLPNGIPVSIRVRAVNAGGPGPEGESKTAIPMEPQQLTSNRNHSLVLDGARFFAWGGNNEGQLGIGSTNAVNAPALVQPPVSFTHISTGDEHTLALDEDGNVWLWGYNFQGQLGNGTSNAPNAPSIVMVPGEPDLQFVRIAAGGAFSLAIDSSGHLWSWGSDQYGALGDGGGRSDLTSPAKISGADNTVFTAVSAGYVHGLALDEDGNLWSWGHNFDGQLGNGKDGNGEDVFAATRVEVAGDPAFADVKAGFYGSAALDREGNLWGWGASLADADSTTAVPTQLTDTNNGDPEFVRLAAGFRHALAVDDQGNLWTWGRNSSGQLGLGDTNNRDEPTEVTFPDRPIFKRIAAGDGFSVALDNDGYLWAWGADGFGEAGTGRLGRGGGDVGNTNQPILVSSIEIDF